MSIVVPLLPNLSPVDRARVHYDLAQRRAVALYHAPSSTPEERRAAVAESIRLHRKLVQEMVKAGQA